MSNPRPSSRNRLRFLWPILILLVAVIFGFLILNSGPTTQAKDEKRTPKTVKTMKVIPSDESLVISVYGTVIPTRQATISPEVRGRVERHHPALEPGGFLAQDEEIIAIEEADYQLILNEKKAALEEAIYQHEVEQGRQVVASREWELLRDELEENQANKALVLRLPHLRRTEALLQMASNEIAKAELNLKRTSVRAPFNAMVLSETVEVGEVLDPNSDVATLVGTDEFWVQASLPVDQLKWIQRPTGNQAGAKAEVVLEAGQGQSFRRQGRVLRLLSDLEPKSLMARLLIQVRDPLSLDQATGKLPLLLGSYVRIDIDAGTLENVLSIQRSAVHEGHIWVVGADRKLKIRPVEVLWIQKDTVLINNVLQPDEALVVSSLRVALPDMEVTPVPVSAPDQPAQVTKSPPLSP